MRFGLVYLFLFGLANANVYLTGYAGSSDFPVTPGAMQTRLQQGCGGAYFNSFNSGDAFVAKIATDATGLL